MTAHSVNENITKDGRTVICQWTNTPMRDAQGAFVGFLSMVQDITEHQQAEEAVQRSEALLRAVTDNSPDPIFLKDRDCRLLFANPATLRHRQASRRGHRQDRRRVLRQPGGRPGHYGQ